jgi:hypothetical protein
MSNEVEVYSSAADLFRNGRDPERNRELDREREKFVNSLRPISEVTCEMRVCESKYILPSGRIIYLNLRNLENRYRFGFEVVWNEDQHAVPGKLLYWKNTGYLSCGRPARYENPDALDSPFDAKYVCAICAGKEELPADRPVLTLEALDAEAEKQEQEAISDEDVIPF